MDHRLFPDPRTGVAPPRRGRWFAGSTGACRAIIGPCSAATAPTFSTCASYEWGDDVRHIDWNVTARMDELFVREFMEDRELTAWLLLDRSRSMAFGAAGRTKERVLCELAATFGQLLVRGGNRVGAIIYDGEHHGPSRPGKGRNQVLRADAGAPPPGQRGNVRRTSPSLLGTAARVVRRRSLVVLISDFISEPGWERPLLRLTQRHEVVAVRMVDPREYELPDAGLLYRAGRRDGRAAAGRLE